MQPFHFLWEKIGKNDIILESFKQGGLNLNKVLCGMSKIQFKFQQERVLLIPNPYL